MWSPIRYVIAPKNIVSKGRNGKFEAIATATSKGKSDQLGGRKIWEM